MFRFTAVTSPISYAKQKRSRRVYAMIAIPWAISFAISSPIALGMNYTDRRTETPTLCTFYNSDFLIYSSMGSFYIPCIVMPLLSWRIYLAIRNRTRRRAVVVDQRQVKTREARALNGTYGNNSAEEDERREEEEEEEEEKDEVVKMVNGELALRGGILLPFSSRYATQRKKMSTLSSDDRPVHERMQLNSEDSEVGDDADDNYGTTELELTPEKSHLMISEKVLLLPSGMTTF